MRKLLFSLVSAGLLLSSTASADTDRSVNFDLSGSTLKWVGKKVTGSHEGELKLKSASGRINADSSVAGKFEVDMTTIKNTDIESPKDSQKLVDHLSSPDFFKIDSFPVATFEIISSKPITDARAGEPNTMISGQLSIKGITQPVSFPAVVSVEDGKVSAKGTAVIDRTLFDVRYGSGKFFQGLGDKLIYDNFEVQVDLKGDVVA